MGKIRDKQPDADAGRVMVDEQLEDLEARLTAIYTDVAKEMQKDMDSFMDRYKAEDEKKKEQVENGELSQEAYESWKERQIFRSDAMQAKIDDLTSRAVNADKQAMAMVNDQLPETYATSYNFGGYKGEVLADAAGYDYTGFTIINQDAVKTLMKDNPDLIPWKPDVDVTEDKKWNREKIQEAVLQGVVKGDSMDDVAKRLLPVVNMDKNAAIRTARTAVNGIENKGRKDATERVKEAGIPMVERWSCTHDDRTRDTHILLDGTEPNEKGQYGEGILDTLLEYPGDPAGDPEEVYNCRCGTTSTIEGIDHSKDQDLYAQFMEQNYYEDWVNVKESIDTKEAAFQAKKEGAAERVEARKERQAEKEAEQVEKNGNKEETPSGQESDRIIESEFTPAQNIKEAEDFARNTFIDTDSFSFKYTGKDVSFKGIDVDVANAVNKRLNTIYDNFNIKPLSSLESLNKTNKQLKGKEDAPMMASNFGNIGLNSIILKNEKTISDYIEQGQKDYAYVMDNLDSLSGSMKEKAEQYLTAGRSLVDESIEGMVTHEVGHVISFGEYNKEFADIGKNDDWKEYAVNISGYANSSYGEYLAESFTAYFNGEYDLIQPEVKDLFDKLRKDE